MPCRCSEIGKDGTKEHSGELRVFSIRSTDDHDHLFQSCENHIDCYKAGNLGAAFGLKELQGNEKRLTLLMRMTEQEKVDAFDFLFGLFNLNTDNPDLKYAAAFDRAVKFASSGRAEFSRPEKKH